jgi:sugar phosphate isomerase/epimerase
MESNPQNNGSAPNPLPGRKLAGAPISWGVCEVPGWGRMLPPERVLSEMASLGLSATEMGPVGYLPPDAEEVRALLRTHGLGLVAAFVPLVLHERSLDQARAVLEEVMPLIALLDGEVLVAAAVTDAAWSARVPLVASGSLCTRTPGRSSKPRTTSRRSWRTGRSTGVSTPAISRSAAPTLSSS